MLANNADQIRNTLVMSAALYTLITDLLHASIASEMRWCIKHHFWFNSAIINSKGTEPPLSVPKESLNERTQPAFQKDLKWKGFCQFC